MATEDWVLIAGLFAFMGYLAFLAYLRTQPPAPSGSTVLVERTDSGYIIRETRT